VENAIEPYGSPDELPSGGASRRGDSARDSVASSSRPSISSSARKKQLSSRMHDLTDIIGRNVDFSTFTAPQEVEFRDTAGDLVTFTRSRGPKARADFYVNGHITIKSIHAVEVEGCTLHVEGSNCSEGPIASTTVPMGGPERDTFANRKANILERRLDRDRRDAEPDVDWSSGENIIRQVLQLVDGLDGAAPIEGGHMATELELPFSDAKRGKEHEVVPFGGFLDMTPEGFKVLHNRFLEPPKARIQEPTLREGMYFFFDDRTFPRFPFDTRVWEVEQWRNGNMVWSGMVLIERGIDGGEAAAETDSTARGCREPASERGERQWQLGDTVFVLGFHQDNKAFAGFTYDDNLTAYEMQIGSSPPTKGGEFAVPPQVHGFHDDRSLGERLEAITKHDLMTCKGCPSCDRIRSNPERAKPRPYHKPPEFRPSLWERLDPHPEEDS